MQSPWKSDAVPHGLRVFVPCILPSEVLIAEDLHSYPEIKQDRFIFIHQKRPLMKDVGELSKGTLIDCYTVKLAEGAK